MPTINNPFVVGNSVNTQEFLGRGKEIRRIVGRICSGGQSVAVIGEPRIGKTSLLRYLAASENRQGFYGDLSEKLIFQYVDASTFGSAFTQTQFWWRALTPLAEKLPEIDRPALTAAYETCEKEGFGVFVLEKLLAQLNLAGLRIVLTLDEFDTLLTHPVLNKSEFYGGLRSLDTRCGSLALVIASRQSLEMLNARTQEYSRMGSPYFNYMTPVLLGAFAEKDVHTLLARGDAHFTKADKDYLVSVAGGNPFLLQTAAFNLWDAYEEDGETDEKSRWEITAHELLDDIGSALTDAWRLWSPETRKAMTIIALDTLPHLVKGKEFDIQALIASLETYTPEVEELKKRGILVIDKSHKSGYRFQAQITLVWLANELVRVARSQDGEYLNQWQREQQLEGLLKGPEKSQLQKALSTLGPLVKTGTGMVLEAFINTVVGKMIV